MTAGILGEKKSVLGFKALGVAAFAVNCREDLLKARDEIKRKKLAILFITEEIAQDYAKEIELFYSQTLPAVLVVPGLTGKSEKGRQGLKDILERALGSDIIN